MTEKSLKHASWLTEFGFELIPLNSDPADKHYRKRPRDKDWRGRKYKVSELQAAFRSIHAIGARVPTGYVVIDVDVKGDKQGLQSLSKFPQDDLFSGSYVTTGSKGLHIFFKLPEGVDKIDTNVKELPDIDFRVVGSQVVAAGSINNENNPYTWDESTADLEFVTIPEIPAAIWNFLKPLQREIKRSTDTNHPESSIYSDDELRRLLNSINVEDYRSQDEWFKVLMAAHEATGGLGMDVFYDWSHTDPDPRKRVTHAELTKRWKSLDAKAAQTGGITRKYLESIATSNARALNDFDPKVMEAAGIPPIKFAKVTPSKVDNPSGAAKLNLGPELQRNQVVVASEQELLDRESSEDDNILNLEDMLVGPLDELNSKYAVVQVGGQVRIAQDSVNFYGQRIFHMLKMHDFLILTQNLPKMEEQRGNLVMLVPISNKWVEWAGRRQYNRVDFFPGCSQSWVDRHYSGALNLWTGWSVEPIELADDDPSIAGDMAVPPEECSHFTRLICHLSGRPDALDADFMPDETRYLLDWLAYSFAFANEPIGVAVALRGRKGIGKGVLSQFLSWMTGEYTWSTADMDQVIGKYNGNVKKAVFLFLDEALWSGNKTSARRFQNLITEPTVSTEEKGLQSIVSRNCLHILLSSNDEWIVPASGSDERRYAVLDCHSGLKHDDVFWRDIKSLYSLNSSHIEVGNLEDKKRRLGTLMGWLIARGYWLHQNGWIANRNIPVTEALQEQLDHSKDAFDLWWEHSVLEMGEFGNLDILDACEVAATSNSNEEGYAADVWIQTVNDQFLASEFGQEYLKLKTYTVKGLSVLLGKFLQKKIPGLLRDKVTVPKEERATIEHSLTKFQAYRYRLPKRALKQLARMVSR